MDIYARHGVPNYWIVDPMRWRVEAFILVDGACELAVAASDGGMFSAPPFSDLAIPLAELWA